MKTKEEVEDICRRMDNLWETLRKYSGAEVHECARLMNWFINQSHHIRSFYEIGRMDKIDEIYNSSIKLINEAGAFIRKHKLY